MLYAGCKGEVVAIDAESGRVVWHNRLEGGTFGHLGRADMTLLDSDGRLFVGANGFVVCLDAATGAELWRHEFADAGRDWVSFAAGGQSAVAEGAIIAARRAAAKDAPASPQVD